MPFALDARSTAGAWALEGAALVWLGFRQSRVLGRGFGYLLLAFAGLWLLVGTVVNSRTSAINATLLNGLLLAASSLAAAWCMQRFSRGILADPETGGAARWVAESLLIGWGTLWLGLVMLVEISEFVKDGYELAACLVCLAAAALVYSGLSVGLRWRRVSLPVIGYAPLLAACVWGLASEGLDPAAGGGWWGWPLALAAHLVVVRRVASEWPAWARELGHMLGVLAVAALGALQGRAVTADWGEAASAWPWLGWLVVPAGVLLSLLHPRLARSWPVNAAPWAYRTGACGVLTIGLLLWALVANWVSDGSASPLPHVPFMNPLDLGVGVAMLAAWRWRAGDGARAAPDLVARLVFVAIAIDGFIWLNAILIRAFHHWLGVPFRFDAWTASLAVQTGISLLWSVTALVLMWAATRRAVRTPWIAGAALLAAVVVKLLAVDLSGSGTVTRIVSFIGVGVLMLVIGYVAPLPGRGSTHDAP
jgi:uncharacterized membrane protein